MIINAMINRSMVIGTMINRSMIIETMNTTGPMVTGAP